MQSCCICNHHLDSSCSLHCKICLEASHAGCVDVKFRNVDPSGWVCPTCTLCKTCLSEGDEASMLLCEGCNAGYHTYCLQPPLNSVPEGEWRCPSCSVPSFQLPLQQDSVVVVRTSGSDEWAQLVPVAHRRAAIQSGGLEELFLVTQVYEHEVTGYYLYGKQFLQLPRGQLNNIHRDGAYHICKHDCS